MKKLLNTVFFWLCVALFVCGLGWSFYVQFEIWDQILSPKQKFLMQWPALLLTLGGFIGLKITGGK